MGEKQDQPFQPLFNASLKGAFQGSQITADGGLILVRELDERFGFGDLIAWHLTDSRRGKNAQLPLADLLRQCVDDRIAGYEDVNDAERLSQDPTFRLIGPEKIWARGTALTSRLPSFETEVLAQQEDLVGLAAINRQLIAKAEAVYSSQRVAVDMDSTEIPVYSQQEHGAYNGHFESTCYHSISPFSRNGDCLAAKRRPGNVHSAEDWEGMPLPEIARQQKLGKEVVFRADAVFAKPEIYEALEERRVKYAIRIPADDNLEGGIAELLTRPVGRPGHNPLVWYKSFLYQAESWRRARRVVAKVEFRSGELFPRVGFIVTDLETDGRAVVRFCNKRGTAGAMDQGKQAVKMTHLSCRRFRSSEEPLWLERHRLQSGRPLAEAGAAAARGQLVVDQSAKAFGKDRRPDDVDQACAVILAAAGGGSSDAATCRGLVWRIAALPVPAGGKLAAAGRESGQKREAGTEECLGDRAEGGHVTGWPHRERAPPTVSWGTGTRQERRGLATSVLGCILCSPRTPRWKSRLI